MYNDITSYLENTKKPWGVLFYRVIWEQLSQITGCKILDFGSGLGITANHLAKQNDVIAIEPNADMVKMRACDNSYHQVIGGIEHLRQLEDDFFDVVVCHNVFEYAKEREDIFKEFCRVLKPGGIMSIVKHNHIGRVMQKVVFENSLDEAINLLDGGKAEAMTFGEINYYGMDDIRKWMGESCFSVERILGVRTFFALHQNNEIKDDPVWQDKMFEIEMRVSTIDEYINVSFYNHVFLRKHK